MRLKGQLDNVDSRTTLDKCYAEPVPMRKPLKGESSETKQPGKDQVLDHMSYRKAPVKGA